MITISQRIRIPLLIFALCFMSAVGISTFFLKRSAYDAQTFAHCITQKLHTAQQEILHELASLGISKKMILDEERVNTKLSIHLAPRFKNLPKVSKETEIFVTKVLNSLPPMNQDFVILHDAKIPCEAACNGNVVLINEEKFNQLSIPARKFVVAHEAAHTFYRDGFVLDKILKQLHINDLFKLARENPDHPVCKFSRFGEWRADIWAVCLGPEYLDGYKAFAQELRKLVKFKEARTHPSCKERCQLAQAMIKRSNLHGINQISFA